MPVLGDTLRLVEPAPLTDEVIAQHAELDIAVQGIYRRMHQLAPAPKDRHWYSLDGVARNGSRVTYLPSDNKNLEMQAWLRTVNWRKGCGPGRREAASPYLEIDLCTKARAIGGALVGRKGWQQDRVQASAGELIIYKDSYHVLDLKGILYESATNVLTDINDTLDLIESASS